MILTHLKGGLGNQMFQYACGRALSLRAASGSQTGQTSQTAEQTLLLDISNYEHQPKKETPRSYRLDNFMIQGKIATADEIKKIRYPFGIFSKIAQIIDTKFLRNFNIGYNKMIFDQITHRAQSGKNVYLEGFWWSEKYFKDAEAAIRNDFKPKNPLSPTTQKIADQITTINNEAKSTNGTTGHSISLHVRRGDYVFDPKTNAYHGVCSKEYYDEALAYLSNGPHKVFIFSDDIEWVKENMHFPFSTIYISGLSNEIEELTLMSMCEYHIIANSSFSWWGAWLDPRPDKIVIAPLHWTRKKTQDANDMIPEGWIRI